MEYASIYFLHTEDTLRASIQFNYKASSNVDLPEPNVRQRKYIIYFDMGIHVLAKVRIRSTEKYPNKPVNRQFQTLKKHKRELG